MASETENNAPLWLQMKEKLGQIARQERLSLNINTGRVCPSPTPSRSHRWDGCSECAPAAPNGRAEAGAGTLLSTAVIFNLPLAKG